MSGWIPVFGIPALLFALAGVDMWRQRRRRRPDVCSPMNRCEECS